MPIFQIQNREKGFTQIDNRLLNDKNLSWRARGLLSYLLSKPSTWKVNIKHLVDESEEDGRTSVRSTLEELQEKGYVEKEKKRNQKGQFSGNVYKVYEDPQGKNDSSDNPSEMSKPDVGNSNVGEPPTSNKEHSNKESNNIEAKKLGSEETDPANKTDVEEKTNEITGEDVNEIIDAFEEVNPTYEQLFQNKTQRDAARRLAEKFGFSTVMQLVRMLPQVVEQKYAPTITTPYKLEKKMGDLKAYLAGQQNEEDKTVTV